MLKTSNEVKNRNLTFPVLALLGSSSTLICCVIPAILVSLGLGSALANFIGIFPQITWFSEHKTLTFSVAGGLIACAGLWEWKRRNDPCPTDPELAKSCMKLRRISWRLWLLSALLYSGSLVFVFLS